MAAALSSACHREGGCMVRHKEAGSCPAAGHINVLSGSDTGADKNRQTGTSYFSKAHSPLCAGSSERRGSGGILMRSSGPSKCDNILNTTKI
jgi:hypothetical protein